MATRPTTYKTLKGSLLEEREKAIHFRVEMPGNMLNDTIFWFPLSQIAKIKRSHSSELDEIDVAQWLYDRKCEDLANMGDD